MITAYAVSRGGSVALKLDRAAADDYASRYGGTVHELVEKAAILRKFDAYAPADQASSMRYRILQLQDQAERAVACAEGLAARVRELEAQVLALQARAQSMP